MSRFYGAIDKTKRNQMKWEILNKKNIEKLKTDGLRILVYNKKNPYGDVPFDLLTFLDLTNPLLGISANKIKSHWASLANDELKFHKKNCKCAGKYDFTDEELLDAYTHFILIEMLT